MLLFVGGSGVSYALGVIEGLLQDCASGDGRTTSVELVWTVRESDLLQHFIPHFRDLLAVSLNIPTINLNIHLHCTSTSILPSAIATHSLQYLREAAVAPNVVYGARPNLGEILGSLAERTPVGGGLAVCSCGPQPMIDGIARLVDGLERGLKVRAGVECFFECVPARFRATTPDKADLCDPPDSSLCRSFGWTDSYPAFIDLSMPLIVLNGPWLSRGSERIERCRQSYNCVNCKSCFLRVSKSSPLLRRPRLPSQPAKSRARGPPCTPHTRGAWCRPR